MKLRMKIQRTRLLQTRIRDLQRRRRRLATGRLGQQQQRRH